MTRERLPPFPPHKKKDLLKQRIILLNIDYNVHHTYDMAFFLIPHDEFQIEQWSRLAVRDKLYVRGNLDTVGCKTKGVLKCQ